MVASEAQPFSKTGGLADVAGSLTRALGATRARRDVVTPRYRGVAVRRAAGTVRAHVAGHWFEARTCTKCRSGRMRARSLVDCPPLYDRGGIYAEHGRDYDDNPIRFAFLSIAALEWAAWQPAPPIVDSRARLAGGPAAGLRADRTIGAAGRRPTAIAAVGLHDSQHRVSGHRRQGWVPRLGLSWEDFHVNGFEFWDRLSYLKAGVQFSDVAHHGEPDLRARDPAARVRLRLRRRHAHARASALVGILNGIDVEEWNPAQRSVPAGAVLGG